MKEDAASAAGLLLFAIGFLVSIHELLSPILQPVGTPDWILVLGSVTTVGGLAAILVGAWQPSANKQ
jgi:hypothetical protein